MLDLSFFSKTSSMGHSQKTFSARCNKVTDNVCIYLYISYSYSLAFYNHSYY
ncbi:hypothetical protein [Helicobacter acinonychis]|uniref:hypothetical protein n=1 Tax=Helicobacter acinonychis TaxID=212 RepID=UPI001CD914C7|nr:hypothetical protein [Helicobacter acinonychis]